MQTIEIGKFYSDLHGIRFEITGKTLDDRYFVGKSLAKSQQNLPSLTTAFDSDGRCVISPLFNLVCAS